MSRAPRTTIEQWLALRVVVESGGFAQAAERLNRSQSSVSYAVQRLQERLGVALLKIEGRKARLTDIGRTMLADASPLIDELVQLEGRSLAADLAQATIRLLVDSLFSKRRLFGAFAKFQQLHPEVEIVLRENVRQTVPDPAIDPFDLAIAPWALAQPGSHKMADVELIAVASVAHPLSQSATPLSRTALAPHRVAVIDASLRGDSAREAPPAGAPQGGRQWHLNHLESAVEAVSSGLCYGWLPRHLIAGRLERGELIPLRLAADATLWVPLTLVYADNEAASAVTRDMASLLMADDPPASLPRGEARALAVVSSHEGPRASLTEPARASASANIRAVKRDSPG